MKLLGAYLLTKLKEFGSARRRGRHFFSIDLSGTGVFIPFLDDFKLGF
jgi:hypothetical protein